MQLFALLAICVLSSDVYGKTASGDASKPNISAVKESTTNYGDKTGASSNTQIKRDISLSYAATNIDSKEGTRVKTITVIKNLNNNKNERLKINPKLHKNEEWASAFRDNFDSYGHLPDVPDIDDLFEFVNKKTPKDDKKTETTLASGSMPKEMGKAAADGAEKKEKKQPMKPVEPKAEKEDDDVESLEDVEVEVEKRTKQAEATTKKAEAEAKLNSETSAETVEKIKGDAEVIPLTKNRQRPGQGHGALGHSSRTGGGARGSSGGSGSRKSQSLGKDKERYVESMFNVNYSTPLHSVHQYFENYVQEIPKGYEYPKPCQQAPPNSVQVTTPSGRSYDVPNNRSGYGLNPYLAPSLTRKTQITSTTPQPNGYNYQNPNLNNNNNNPYPGTYSVNSILPPLQPQGGGQRNLNLYPPLGNGNVVNIPIPSTTLQPASYGGAGNTNSGAPNQQGFPTTQRPYLAPNLRNGLNGLSRGVHVISNFMYNKQLPNGYRSNNNVFGGGNGGGGLQRPSSVYRSRGIKY